MNENEKKSDTMAVEVPRAAAGGKTKDCKNIK